MKAEEFTPDTVDRLGSIDHAADFYRRYPGETVVFFTRVETQAGLARFRIQITLPPGLLLVDVRPSLQLAGQLPMIVPDEETQYLIWDVERARAEPARIEIRTEARVAPATSDRTCESRAVLIAADEIFAQDAVSVLIQAKGKYLKYLPNLYNEDELMGRFLMLFESFLAPIEQRIEGQSHFFDPKLTPPDWLPWLASWSGLVLDEDMPDERRRVLLQESSSLYKKRGTRQGLTRYLEVVTGGSVQITEHFSENFCLGPTAFLGPGIALGTENRPNTFSVRVSLPPPAADCSTEARMLHRQRMEQKVASILEREKPAHTSYDLHLDVDPGEPG